MVATIQTATVKAVYALTPIPKKAILSPLVGEMAELSLYHPEQRSASSGMSIPNANPIIDPLITSAPSAPPKAILSSRSVSNYNKIVIPLSADGFDTLLHHYDLTL
jgi:hypothetical protein